MLSRAIIVSQKPDHLMLQKRGHHLRSLSFPTYLSLDSLEIYPPQKKMCGENPVILHPNLATALYSAPQALAQHLGTSISHWVPRAARGSVLTLKENHVPSSSEPSHGCPVLR